MSRPSCLRGNEASLGHYLDAFVYNGGVYVRHCGLFGLLDLHFRKDLVPFIGLLCVKVLVYIKTSTIFCLLL